MSQSVHSGADDIFLKGKVEEGIKVFVFEGFKLGSVNREAEFIKENVPVTEGNWFVLFFVKDGYIPGVRVLRAGKEDVEIGKVGFEKRMDGDRGFLTGVVYKPVHGGKVLYSRGIFKLIDGTDIKVISDRGESYLTRSKGGGIFSISLIPGKYRIFIGDSKEWINVLIERGKTTIQNLQKGLMLID